MRALRRHAARAPRAGRAGRAGATAPVPPDSCGRRADDPPRFGEPDELAQPRHLGGEHPPAERRQAVVDAARVIARRPATPGGGFHESLALDPPVLGVEVSRLELDASLGVLEDVLADAV